MNADSRIRFVVKLYEFCFERKVFALRVYKELSLEFPKSEVREIE